jgi:UDP-galactopyranose mutase
LDVDFDAVRATVRYRHLVYTGPLDAYYEHRLGRLPYRSLRWEYETLAQPRYQPAMQVNYPNDHDFTRILEPKQVTGQVHPMTTIIREYPQAQGEPFYAVPTPSARALYQRYADIAAAEPNVSFVGRLASYRHYNMDQVVAMALAEAERVGPRLRAA